MVALWLQALLKSAVVCTVTNQPSPFTFMPFPSWQESGAVVGFLQHVAEAIRPAADEEVQVWEWKQHHSLSWTGGMRIMMVLPKGAGQELEPT